MDSFQPEKKDHGIRIIKTARTLQMINEGAKAGFQPLVKKVEPSIYIRSKYKLIQNKLTGEVQLISDFRHPFRSGHFPDSFGLADRPFDSNFETVIDWTYYYPYSFPSPFAAYLLPKDLVIGEEVFLEDVIEDFPEGSNLQGDYYRLKSCLAIWDGKNLQLRLPPIRFSTYIE